MLKIYKNPLLEGESFNFLPMKFFALLLSLIVQTFVFMAIAYAENFGNVEFNIEPQVNRTLLIDELTAIAAVVSIKVSEVHENTERFYRALPARPVFDKVFGKDWEKAQEIVFTCIDGYQPQVSVKKFLSHDAYFAIANGDDEPFILTNRLQNNEFVALGPLYRVWDNNRFKGTA